jgi:hypothetical protein
MTKDVSPKLFHTALVVISEVHHQTDRHVNETYFFNIHLKSYPFVLIKSQGGTHTGAVFFVVDG